MRCLAGGLLVLAVSRRYNQLYADGDEDDSDLVEQVSQPASSTALHCIAL